ncbi:MAG: 50S ribosomal protein L25/general stress protein Ctc [Alphaproteobacteria bacterium]|nr:50S ribosomal protein L25/general stress protein Ctc [Alphaproteobacteria bacterium]
MSETTEISAIERTRVGKGSARAARRAGMVPAVIYGDKKSPLSIELEARVIRKIIHEPGIFGRLLNINVDGTVTTVLTRDIQMHPVTDEPLHMDMLRVGKQSTVAVAVPVEFINEGLAPGLKIGGVLNIVRHEIELNCPAGNIPEKIVIDLSGVNVGDSIHISAVNLPSDATPTITDRDFTIATLQSPGGGVKNLDEEDEEAGEEASAEEGESTE